VVLSPIGFNKITNDNSKKLRKKMMNDKGRMVVIGAKSLVGECLQPETLAQLHKTYNFVIPCKRSATSLLRT
jgi:hypothetical protein